MEVVKQFNSELSALYESKPPISKAKMTSITRTAIKAIKLYKHVVQSVEKFIQKCKPEYKVPGLYVIDSIVRQSRHQFGTDKDVFAPRFARNLQQTFVHLFSCPAEDKSKVIRVLNLWQKNAVFESDVIQPLFDLADPNHPIHKEQPAVAPSNGIAPVKPPAVNPPKTAAARKEGGTANWINQLPAEPTQPKPHVSSQAMDVNIIQQLQHLQTLLLDQQSEKAPNKDSDQVKFDKKLLDFDYGEEEDEDGQGHHQQQQQVVASLDSLGSILSNPEVMRQLQTLQQTLSNPQQARQQQLDMEEKMRKMQEMRQQEEEFDKHLAQTVPNLPFADQCELKPGVDLSFPGMDLSQPPPGYHLQQKLVVPAGMMMKPPPSPLEDGERANSDADERMGRDDEGPSVVVLDSDSPSSSPARSRRRRRRSRSRSHRRSRSDSRSRSYNKRKRSSSYDDRDWEKMKQREAEKEKDRERKRKGLPTLKINHLAVCSTTLWIGHLSKLVQQEELSDTFGEFGDIVSIDLIPPRGCAFICMNRRQDAYRALQDLKHHKLQGKAITLAWAPGKGMKGKEYKDYWEVEQGVSYIPWSKISRDVDLELLEEGGMIDEESFPEWLKERQKKNKDDEVLRSQSSSQAEDDDMSRSGELDIPVPAPTLPGFIPLPDGPQPDLKVNQPPPNMPPMMAAGPPLSMMPPFVPRLLGPMGMAMGPGLMPNVPLGVPPPGLMGNPLMHQQMMGRMPQPVGSPFNPPPGVGILGGHPQLSQIPLPGSQDKGKAGLNTLGPGEVPTFSDPLMQIPFTLPPQLQMPPGMSLMTRAPMNEKSIDDSNEGERKLSSPSRNDVLMAINAQFGQPPPQFSPMSLMKIPPPMSMPHLSKTENSSDDKDERENKDKDYRDSLKDRDKERDRDRDYRNKRDRDYRGDRDYRDRYDKDYRERDKDYRDKDRKDRRDRSRDRDKEDKNEDSKEKEGEKDRKDDTSKERNDRDKGRSRDRDRERDRGRDRKWGDRDRDRERDRDEKRGRDRERERSKDMKGSSDRDKGGVNVQDRLRSLAHEQDRGGEFSRGGMDPDDFQGPGGPQFGQRNEGFRQDNFQPDLHGHPGNRHDSFNNRGPRDMFDPRGPPPDGFGPRGPPPDGFGLRGPPPGGFGPRGPSPDGFGSRGLPPGGFGPRGPSPDGFGPRGPPPDGFGPRGPPDGFDHRGPPGGFGPPDNFDPRASHPDFDGPDNFGPRGPPENFNRGLLSDNFGPGSIPPDGFPHRGPPNDDFGPPPFDGFGGPPGEFQPRIRIEFFNRGRGRGLQDNFRGRGARGGPMFSPRGNPRGPRPGSWVENQSLSPPKPGFGFPPRGFAPPEGIPERFGPPAFEESGQGRGQPDNRGRGRGFPVRPDEHRREEDEAGAPSPKRSSRWSNLSPPLQSEEEMHKADEATAEAIMAQVNARETQDSEGVCEESLETSKPLNSVNYSSCTEQSVNKVTTTLEPLHSKNSEEEQHMNEHTSNLSATNINKTSFSTSEPIEKLDNSSYASVSENEERQLDVHMSLLTEQQPVDVEPSTFNTNDTVPERSSPLELIGINESKPESLMEENKPTLEGNSMFDSMEVEGPHPKEKLNFDDATQNVDPPNPFDTMAHLPNVDELRENVCSTQSSVGYEDDSRIVESLGFDKKSTEHFSTELNECMPQKDDMAINEPKENFNLYEDETFSVGDEPKQTFSAVLPEEITQNKDEVIDGMEFDIEPYDSQRVPAPEDSSTNNNDTVEDVSSQ